MPHIQLLSLLGDQLSSVQSTLAFDRWASYPQFNNDRGYGRIALLACILGIVLGVHVIVGIQLVLLHVGILPKNYLIFGGKSERWASSSNENDLQIMILLQWVLYIIVLCIFHLAEFFTTAVYNPTATSADSFMVNHSKHYTAAALISCTEFWIRALSFPTYNSRVFYWGIVLVLGGQLCRIMAMVTCGESFNHYIQRDRKENHILITHGIYQIFRHPSYVGFYYWAVGTQLVLNNPISTILYAIAAWTFFRYRIAYEEETLRKLFPQEYESYVARTYIGIPLIRLALRLDDNNKKQQ